MGLSIGTTCMPLPQEDSLDKSIDTNRGIILIITVVFMIFGYFGIGEA